MSIEELAKYYIRLLRDANFANIGEVSDKINNLIYDKSRKKISRDDKIKIINQIEKELQKKTRFFDAAPRLNKNKNVLFENTDSKDNNDLIKILLDNID